LTGQHFYHILNQNKDGKYVCILCVLEDFEKCNYTVSARVQYRDTKMHSHRGIETMTLDTRAHEHNWVLYEYWCAEAAKRKDSERVLCYPLYLLILNLQSASCHDGSSHSIVVLLYRLRDHIAVTIRKKKPSPSASRPWNPLRYYVIFSLSVRSINLLLLHYSIKIPGRPFVSASDKYIQLSFSIKAYLFCELSKTINILYTTTLY